MSHTSYPAARPKAVSAEEALFGMVQPSAVPLEEAILGAILIDRDAFPMVEGILTAESFYLKKHQDIFAAVLRLWAKQAPIDLLTVTEELRRVDGIQAIDGGMYLVGLSNRVASGANVEYHARIIAQKKILRDLISLSQETIRAAFDPGADAFDALDNFQRLAMNVGGGVLSRGDLPEHISAALVAAMQEIEEAGKRGGGLSSGLSEVDRAGGDYHPGELTCIAARPGMGKTEYALTGAMANARAGNKVWFVSLEMSGAQLCKRLVSGMSGVSVSDMRRGDLTEGQWGAVRAANEQLASLPIHFCGFRSVRTLFSAARKAVAQNELGILFVDYLQLFEADGTRRNTNREQDVSEMSRGLKLLSKELKIPVVMLSQLSRNVENRANRMPELSDLRESGAIEQDCDVVTFLFRPDYYDIPAMEINGREISAKGTCLVYSRKHRHGSLFDAVVGFENGRFKSLGEESSNQIPAFQAASLPTTRPDFDAETPF